MDVREARVSTRGRARETPLPHLEGQSSPAHFWLHAEDLPWKHLLTKKYSLFHFPHEEQRQHIQAGICLKLGFIPIFHLERYLHVCLTKCGITHLIKISDTLKLLDELGH